MGGSRDHGTVVGGGKGGRGDVEEVGVDFFLMGSPGGGRGGEPSFVHAELVRGTWG